MRPTLFGFAIAVFVGVLTGTPRFAVGQEYPEWHAWYYDEGIYLMHDVEHHLYMARVDFERRDMGGAAKQILTAADYMKLEAGRADTKEERQALIASIQELEKLAQGVVTGKVTSVKELDKALSRAHYVLATHHLWKASEALKKNDAESAIGALKASTFHLERSKSWSAKSAAPTAGGPAKPEAQTSPEPQGWPVVGDKVSTTLSVDLTYHFSQARKNFQKKDLRAAAAEIRTGVAFLKLEETRIKGEPQKALARSIGELEMLAGQIEKGTGSITLAQLDAAFACTDLILARENYHMALEASRKKETENTGYALQAATTLLESAMGLLEHKEEKPVLTLVKETEPVARKLIRGTEVPPAEVGKIANDGIKAVDELDKAGCADK